MRPSANTLRSCFWSGASSSPTSSENKLRTLAPIEIGVAATSIAIAFAIVLYAVIARVIGRPTSEWVLAHVSLLGV